MGIYYLGAFPPSYGGVTVKNQNLYQALSRTIKIEKIDFNLIKKKNIRETIRLIKAIVGRNNRFVIGVSGKQTRKKFTQLLYYINRKAMNHSLIFLMGGTAANDIVSDSEYLKCASGYKMIYAETQGMIKTLEDAGLHNAGYYPNGRFKPKNQVMVRGKDGRLKCVFFSLIQPEKGADIILEVAELLPKVEFSFYGNIDPLYRQTFEEKVNILDNVSYHGIFKGNSEEVYAELRKYDVLLFPTKWEIEGVPGILVEGKIAGLAEVVSNKSYNAELVQDNEEGIVLHENSVAGLVEALTSLENDEQTLLRLKYGSYDSSEHYYIENNIDAVIDEILRGGEQIAVMPPIVINKKVFEEGNEKLKCVFFSAICPEKGVDIILNAAESLPNISFAFYGTLDQDYQAEFRQQIDRLPNAKYYGVFTGDAEAVYSELAKYDVLLLPTRWQAEGVPGILVEAKVAGITAIVSNHNFNKEIISDGDDGIVLQENTSQELVKQIQKIQTDKLLLSSLKSSSRKSAKNYFIENHVKEIIQKLCN